MSLQIPKGVTAGLSLVQKVCLLLGSAAVAYAFCHQIPSLSAGYTAGIVFAAVPAGYILCISMIVQYRILRCGNLGVENISTRDLADHGNKLIAGHSDNIVTEIVLFGLSIKLQGEYGARKIIELDN